MDNTTDQTKTQQKTQWFKWAKVGIFACIINLIYNRQIDGALTISRGMFNVTRHLYKHVYANANLIKQYGKSYAVVTGGSEGLGFAYASCLAKRGFDIILVSRSNEKLTLARNQLQEQFGVKVETIQFDFNTNKQESYQKLASQIDQLGEVGVLINNIGAFKMGLFDQQSVEEINMISNLNIFAVTYFTQLVLQRMKNRQQKSLIAVVGSETGEIPHAQYVFQAATKAFTNHFARSLQIEAVQYGVDVRLFTPGPTLTPLLLSSPAYLKTLKGKIFSSEPIDVAREQLRKVNDYTQIGGTLRHEMMFYITKNHKYLWERVSKLYD